MTVTRARIESVTGWLAQNATGTAAKVTIDITLSKVQCTDANIAPLPSTRGVVDKCRLHNKVREEADSVDGIVVGESILNGEQITVVTGADLADTHESAFPIRENRGDNASIRQSDIFD